MCERERVEKLPDQGSKSIACKGQAGCERRARRTATSVIREHTFPVTAEPCQVGSLLLPSRAWAQYCQVFLLFTRNEKYIVLKRFPQFFNVVQYWRKMSKCYGSVTTKLRNLNCSCRTKQMTRTHGQTHRVLGWEDAS